MASRETLVGNARIPHVLDHGPRIGRDPGPECRFRRRYRAHHSIAAVFRTTATAAAAASYAPRLFADSTTPPKPENLVTTLFESLNDEQRTKICFPWDHTDKRGLLRTHVSNNWSITDTAMNVGGSFYTKDQRDLIEAIFYGLYNPEWHDRLRQQLQDDAGGYGKQVSLDARLVSPEASAINKASDAMLNVATPHLSGSATPDATPSPTN